MRTFLREISTLFMLFIVGTIVLLSYIYVLYAINTTIDTATKVTPTVTYEKDSEGHVISAASSVPFTPTGEVEQQPVDESVLYKKDNNEP